MVLTLAGALVAALSRQMVRSVCGLALSSVGLAGLYYFLASPFLALMQILIYVGAVCVIIMFALMLSEPHEATAIPSLRINRRHRRSAGCRSVFRRFHCPCRQDCLDVAFRASEQRIRCRIWDGRFSPGTDSPLS